MVKQNSNAKKFLLTDLPDEGYLSTVSSYMVCEGYVRNEKTIEERVVECSCFDKDGHLLREFYRIIRRPIGSESFSEDKKSITQEQYQADYDKTVGRRIYKKRWKVRHGLFTFTFDQYMKNCRKTFRVLLTVAMSIAESHAEINKDILPKNIKTLIQEDVTDNEEYLERNLAN